MTPDTGSKAAPKPGFIGGMLAHWRGLDFVMRHPRLIPLIMIPVAINIVLFILFFYLSLRYFSHWLDFLLPQSEAWYWVVLYYLLLVIFAALLALIIIVTFTALANILASPFNDALSERTEVITTGLGEKPFSLKAILKETGRTVIEEIKKIVFYLVVFVIFLGFNLIPILGQFIYGILMALFTVLWLGLTFMDYAFARHGFKFGGKIKFVRRNLIPVFGYGLGVFLGLLIPVLNLVFIPVAVVGGTLLYIELGSESGVN